MFWKKLTNIVVQIAWICYLGYNNYRSLKKIPCLARSNTKVMGAVKIESILTE